MKVLPIL